MQHGLRGLWFTRGRTFNIDGTHAARAANDLSEKASVPQAAGYYGRVCCVTAKKIAQQPDTAVRAGPDSLLSALHTAHAPWRRLYMVQDSYGDFGKLLPQAAYPTHAHYSARTAAHSTVSATA